MKEAMFPQLKSSLITVLSIVLFTFSAEAQFQQIQYPFKDYNSKFQQLDITDSGYGVVVGTCGVMATTDDGGENWHFKNGPGETDLGAVGCLPGTDCQSIIVAGDNIVALSTDGGDTWKSQTLELRDADEIFFMDNGEILLLSDDDRLWRSSDNGESWEEIELPNYPQATWRKVDDYIYTSIGSSEVGYTIIRSGDNGSSWDSLYTYPNYFGHWDFADENNGIYFSSDKTVWRTSDGGFNWELVNDEPNFPSNVTAITSLGGEKYMINHVTTAVLISEDAGKTWTRQDDASQEDGTWVNYVKVVNDNIWVASGSTSVLYSKDGGISFENRIPAIRNKIQGVSFKDDDNGVAIGRGSTVYITDDGGDSWSAMIPDILLNDYYTGYDIDFNADGSIVVCWAQQNPTISADGGETWENLLDPVTQDSVSNMFFYEQLSNGREIVVGGTHIVYRDQGEPWNIITNDSISFAPRFMTFYNDDIGVYGGTRNNLMMTKDGGETWNLLTFPTQSGEIKEVVFIDEETFIASLGTNAYRTSDGGETWDNLGVRFPTGYGMEVGVDGVIYSAGFTSGNAGSFHKSSDGGITWQDLGYVCSAYRDGTLTPSKKYFFAVGDGSIITRYDLDELSSTNDPFINDDMTVLAAFPNPTSGHITIALPHGHVGEEVALSVYDLHGRRVHQAISSVEDFIDLNLESLVRGVYVVQVQGKGWINNVKVYRL